MKALMALASWKMNKIRNMVEYVGMQNFYSFNSPFMLGRILLGSSVGQFRHFLSKTGISTSVVSEKLGYITAGELGLNSFRKGIGLLYCIATEHDRIERDPQDFLVYQGSYMPPKLQLGNSLLLPTCSFMERHSTYMNFEGSLRLAKAAVTPFRKLITDVEVFRLLSKIVQVIIPNNYSIVENFSTVNEIAYQEIITYNMSFFKHINEFIKSFTRQNGLSLRRNDKLIISETPWYLHTIKLNNGILNRSVNNYYSSDAISRVSKTMSLCAQKIINTHFN